MIKNIYSITPPVRPVGQTRIEKTATNGLGQYHQLTHSPSAVALQRLTLYSLALQTLCRDSLLFSLQRSVSVTSLRLHCQQCEIYWRAVSTYVSHDALQHNTGTRARGKRGHHCLSKHLITDYQHRSVISVDSSLTRALRQFDSEIDLNRFGIRAPVAFTQIVDNIHYYRISILCVLVFFLSNAKILSV